MASTELTLNAGLSQLDCPDHYAILGVPIDSAPAVVRKRYLRVARTLHPDSCGPSVDKTLASSILSKMVNPSYEFLSQEKNLDEYAILLRLVGQRCQSFQPGQLQTEAAQSLLAKAANYEEEYRDSVQSLASQQFSTLEQYVQYTEQISELNLVYLMLREGQGKTFKQAGVAQRSPSTTVKTPQTPVKPSRQASSSRAGSSTTGSPSSSNPIPQATSSSSPTSQTPSNQPLRSSAPPSDTPSDINLGLVDQYYRRAEELVSRQCYPEAIRELKEILEGNNPIDPSNSRALTLLGGIYQKYLKSPAMARMYFTKALKSDPNNQEAKKGLDQVNQRRNSKQQSQKPAKPQEKGKFNFFGLFSGKK